MLHDKFMLTRHRYSKYRYMRWCLEKLQRNGEKVLIERASLTDEHLHKLRAGQLEEGRLGLRGTGSSQEGLACSRGPVQQHSLRRVDSQVHKLLFVGHGQYYGLNQFLQANIIKL